MYHTREDCSYLHWIIAPLGRLLVTVSVLPITNQVVQLHCSRIPITITMTDSPAVNAAGANSLMSAQLIVSIVSNQLKRTMALGRKKTLPNESLRNRRARGRMVHCLPMPYLASALPRRWPHQSSWSKRDGPCCAWNWTYKYKVSHSLVCGIN